MEDGPGRLQSLGLQSWTQLSDFHFTNQGEWRSGLPMQETQEIQVQSLGQEDPLE